MEIQPWPAQPTRRSERRSTLAGRQPTSAKVSLEDVAGNVAAYAAIPDQRLGERSRGAPHLGKCQHPPGLALCPTHGALDRGGALLDAPSRRSRLLWRCDSPGIPRASDGPEGQLRPTATLKRNHRGEWRRSSRRLRRRRATRMSEEGFGRPEARIELRRCRSPSRRCRDRAPEPTGPSARR